MILIVLDAKGETPPVPHATFIAAEMNRHKDEVDRCNISC